MSEFQDKVQQYKQTIVETGFKTDDIEITDSSPSSSESISDDFNQSDVPQETNDHIDHQHRNKKPGRKTVEGLKKRIDQITFEKNVREAQTQELLARVQEQEQRLAAQQELLEQNEQYKNAYYENNLQTREQAILNELKVAKEEGDVDKEIALSKELAKVAADQSTYGYYKSQIKNQPRQIDYPQIHNNQPNIYQEPQYLNDYQEPVNEVYDAWLERNAWADPESENYSPRLRNEANELSNELDDMLRYDGKASLIGTPDYFRIIDNLMAERYSVSKESPKQTEANYYNVAPVSRNGSSMADQYIAKNPNNTRRHMTLSEDEYKIARNLKIPIGNGRFATGDEAIRIFAESKRDKNIDPDRPYRITID